MAVKQPNMDDAPSLWHVVVIPNDVGVVHTFASRALLLDWLKTQLGTRAQVFIFEGKKWLTSKGHPKYLVGPDGAKFQVDNPTGIVEIDPNGWLDQ